MAEVQRDLSIVIPLYNEEESLPELCAWITRVVEKNQLSAEILFIDDGSTDGSWSVIQSLASTNSSIKAIQFQ